MCCFMANMWLTPAWSSKMMWIQCLPYIITTVGVIPVIPVLWEAVGEFQGQANIEAHFWAWLPCRWVCQNPTQAHQFPGLLHLLPGRKHEKLMRGSRSCKANDSNVLWENMVSEGGLKGIRCERRPMFASSRQCSQVHRFRMPTVLVWSSPSVPSATM
jgi:hypothetical protein